jgi:L-alanine-DL-glutamate epimerase-like enolase superfamily enzyme
MRISGIRRQPAGAPTTGSVALDAIEVVADDGRTGTAFGSPAAAERAVELGSALLQGEDPLATAAHWSRLDDPAGAGHAARAMLDVALWDLRARSEGNPLWRSLGGARPRSFACARAPDLASDDLRAWFRALAGKYGFRAGLVTLGHADDLARLQAARDELAVNSAAPDLLAATPPEWSGDQAEEAMRRIEPDQDIVCLEAPLAEWSAEEIQRLSGRVCAALCPATAPASAAGLFTTRRGRATDIVRIDPALSGVTGSLQIAEAAYGYELPVIVAGGYGNIGAHLAAAMPTSMYLEIPDPGGDATSLASSVRIENGWAVAGDDPGHGIRVAA